MMQSQENSPGPGSSAPSDSEPIVQYLIESQNSGSSESDSEELHTMAEYNLTPLQQSAAGKIQSSDVFAVTVV